MVATADRLLLLCARGGFDDEVKSAAEALLRQGVDWQRLLAVARGHRLLSLLYYRLWELDRSLVPAPVMGGLKNEYYANLQRNLWLQRELLEVVQRLRQEGVEVIVLKGGALAWTVYPSPALRPMADLDLLVRPEQMGRVVPGVEAGGSYDPASIEARRLNQERDRGEGELRVASWRCSRATASSATTEAWSSRD